jgi:hypothetical protein
LNQLTILVNTLLILTVLAQVPNWLTYSNEGVVMSMVVSPSTDGGDFPPINLLVMVVNQAGLAAVLWYAWTSPRVITLRGEARRQAGYPPLFDMLRMGGGAGADMLGSRFSTMPQPTGAPPHQHQQHHIEVANENAKDKEASTVTRTHAPPARKLSGDKEGNGAATTKPSRAALPFPPVAAEQQQQQQPQHPPRSISPPPAARTAW